MRRRATPGTLTGQAQIDRQDVIGAACQYARVLSPALAIERHLFPGRRLQCSHEDVGVFPALCVANCRESARFHLARHGPPLRTHAALCRLRRPAPLRLHPRANW